MSVSSEPYVHAVRWLRPLMTVMMLWMIAAILLSGMVACGQAPQKPVAAATPEEGIALAVVYDTSGSMQQTVQDASGKMAPKYEIAARALNAIIDRLHQVANPPGGAGKKLHATLVVFRGEKAATAIPFGAFQAEAWRNWLKSAGIPKDSTPLGDAVSLAGNAVLRSPLTQKHVLVVTDGINTKGPDPVSAIPKVTKDAERSGTAVLYHFVAFDIKASVFNGVKQLGATVVGAADEKELNSQLEFILEEKILLEAEDKKP
jgi:hypothetical protein